MHLFNEYLNKDVCNNSLMKGIMENSTQTFAEKKLRHSQEQLRQIITTIVGKFCQLQKENPMLAVEALFRFQSKEIKDMVMCNYAMDATRFGLVDKEQDLAQQLAAAQAYDANIIFGDEQVATVDREEFVITDAKEQWTQEQDEILISNYETVKQLDKKHRYEFLSSLLQNKKSAKDCQKRCKQLKLKQGKGNLDLARGISKSLLAEQGTKASS